MPYSPDQTGQQYYDTPSSHGNYQYVTLKEVIDSLMIEAQDSDSFLKNTDRSKILKHAYQGIRKLNWVASKDVLMVGETIGPSLFMVLPQDYVDYVRVSVIGPDNKLYPLDINRKINIAYEYLQNNQYEIIFDDQGKIITADAFNTYAKPYSKLEFCHDYQGGYFEKDVSELSKWGEVTINERRGNIACSSNLLGKEIILEYYSDGLQTSKIDDGQITIHKMLEETLYNWTYYACIETKRNVPANEKQRALLRYKTTLRKSIKDRSGLDFNEINRLVNIGAQML